MYRGGPSCSELARVLYFLCQSTKSLIADIFLMYYAGNIKKKLADANILWNNFIKRVGIIFKAFW